MGTETFELSFDCVLPSAIFFNNNLEPATIKCYAIIRNLTRLTGYCFASNAYLSQVMQCSETSVKVWIRSLKQEGFINIYTDKTGIHWSRKIAISDNFKKYVRRAENHLPPAGNPPTPSRKSAYIKEDKIKEEKSKETQTPVGREKVLRNFGEFVKMSDSEFIALVDYYGTEAISGLIEEMNDYLASTGKKPYRDYPATLRNWARRKKVKPIRESKTIKSNPHAVGEKSKGEIEADNRQWSTSIEPILMPYIKAGMIHIGSTGWEFNFKNKPNPLKLYFNNPEFIIKCNETMKELGIMV